MIEGDSALHLLVAAAAVSGVVLDQGDSAEEVATVTATVCP